MYADQPLDMKYVPIPALRAGATRRLQRCCFGIRMEHLHAGMGQTQMSIWIATKTVQQLMCLYGISGLECATHIDRVLHVLQPMMKWRPLSHWMIAAKSRTDWLRSRTTSESEPNFTYYLFQILLLVQGESSKLKLMLDLRLQHCRKSSSKRWSI